MAYLVIPMAAADATEDLGRKLIGRYSRLLDLQKRKEDTVLWLAKADIESVIYTALSTYKKRGPKQRKG